ncbi:hypothetical protein BJ508DRAFT_306318 [Ascobolus immersus RN42]|uniref:Uncharacterized protein n=1 Tax=Ascobolus immersus RN42 TaxID=1160509 RepID=A0A3N4I8A2_ASCIM|nr:hypothetical protein BJ508DRAFT_306318 [Ascobolus immersus RN42]
MSYGPARTFRYAELNTDSEESEFDDDDKKEDTSEGAETSADAGLAPAAPSANTEELTAAAKNVNGSLASVPPTDSNAKEALSGPTEEATAPITSPSEIENVPAELAAADEGKTTNLPPADTDIVPTEPTAVEEGTVATTFPDNSDGGSPITTPTFTMLELHLMKLVSDLKAEVDRLEGELAMSQDTVQSFTDRDPIAAEQVGKDGKSGTQVSLSNTTFVASAPGIARLSETVATPGATVIA